MACDYVPSTEAEEGDLVLEGHGAPTLTAVYEQLVRTARRLGSTQRRLATAKQLLADTSAELLQSNTALLQQVADTAQGRDQLHEILRRSPFAIAVRQGDHFVLVNSAWGACLGYAPEEVIGRKALDFVHPDDREAATVQMKHADSGRIVPKRVTRHVRQDGERVELEVHAVANVQFQGARCTLLAAVDVSERRRLEAQVMAADRMISIGTLAAGVAHEINNPLAYVAANVSFAREELARSSPGTAEPEVLQALGEAAEGVGRIAQIVRDLKTLSRTDDEHRAPVDLAHVCGSAIKMAQNQVRHRARLIQVLGAAPPVLGNEGRLGQVVLNLLVNAAQAIAEGAADRNEVRLTVRTDRGGQAVIEVKDTGAGMSPAIQRRLFTPFFTTKPVGTGTGLGLSICQGIVSAHGGTMEVESEVGVGSTFRVILPPSEAARTAEQADEAVARPIGGKRVLIIDDDPLVGRGLKRIIGSEHRVELADSARAGLALCDAGQAFDLVLCDVMMPVMTGEELYRYLEERRPDLARRTIFMTGGAFTPAARAFLDRFPERVVDKPVDKARLRALLLEA